MRRRKGSSRLVKFEQQVEVMNAASWLQAKGLVTVKESARKCYSLKSKDINHGRTSGAPGAQLSWPR